MASYRLLTYWIPVWSNRYYNYKLEACSYSTSKPKETFLLLEPNKALNGGVSGTDVKKRGLASADRNNKATLLLTAPYSMTKSYAKGLSPRMVKLQDVG